MNKIFASLICAVLYALLNVFGNAFIKTKLKEQTLSTYNDWIGFLFSFPTILAFTIFFLSALVMFKALSFANFTFIVPIATGLNFMATVIVGYYLFNEKINVVSFLGFFLILFGIVLLSLNNLSDAK